MHAWLIKASQASFTMAKLFSCLHDDNGAIYLLYYLLGTLYAVPSQVLLCKSCKGYSFSDHVKTIFN